MTNREISVHLKLSEHTVRNYLFRIFDKLGVSSRVELVLYCLQERPSGAADS
jgi:DNA-binding NarL/FixJ family response regulator